MFFYLEKNKAYVKLYESGLVVTLEGDNSTTKRLLQQEEKRREEIGRKRRRRRRRRGLREIGGGKG